MSENHPNKSEIGKETLTNHGHNEVVSKKPEINIEAAKSKQTEQLEAARNKVEAQTVSKEKTLDKFEGQQTKTQVSNRAPINKDLRNSTFKNEIKHIRRQLSAPDRLASKVIHQPVIKAISNASSKTITRPSGLLGGGITAFLGTSLYYYFTKHIGVRYNYLVFIMLFVAGFGIGVCIELIIWAFRSRKKVIS